MGTRAEQIKTDIRQIVRSAWDIRTGRVVPEPENLLLEKNGAVELDATYLYADLAGSSIAAHTLYPEVTGKIIRAYLKSASTIINAWGGEIRSFDGDRVMGIFIGDDMHTHAVIAGMEINWMCQNPLREELRGRFNDYNTWRFRPDNGIGIDTGTALIAKAGVRGRNDLVSIGKAPNVAAKLSALRIGPDIYITEDVKKELGNNTLVGSDGRNMWQQVPLQNVGGYLYTVWGTTYWWEP